jgi:hypothetical protein
MRRELMALNGGQDVDIEQVRVVTVIGTIGENKDPIVTRNWRKSKDWRGVSRSARPPLRLLGRSCASIFIRFKTDVKSGSYISQITIGQSAFMRRP